MLMFRSVIVVVCAGLLIPVVGCRSRGPQPQPEYVAQLSQLRYPEAADHGPDLDIVVVRQGDAIELVNLTPQRYHDLQLWLNRQYVGLVDVIEVGRSSANRLPLARFVNRHREIYRTGTFLSPGKGIRTALAELYDPATKLRHRVRVRQ